MVASLPSLDRLSGVGLAALDRLSLAPAQAYKPSTALGADRTLRARPQGQDRLGSIAGAQPRDFNSFAALRAPALGEDLGTAPRRLGTQSPGGRQLVDPTGGVNQPGLAALQGTGNTTGTQPWAGTGSLSGANPTQYDQAFIDAAREMSAKYGVNLDPALLKAMGHIESGGTFDNSLARDDGFGDGLSVGIMQVKPNLWGNLVPGASPYDPVGNIRIGAALMAKSMAERGGSWERALTEVYFPVNDPNGTTQSMYVNQAKQYMQQYAGGLSPNGQLRTAYQSPQGAQTANSVLNAAKQFVGVAYNWGVVPETGMNPWQTGWDCSGFTYWLDQTYGSKQLPRGSHHQYAWAQQTGNLHGADQLQPGDLVFFNTNFGGGSGANLNPASHVGVYLGGDQFLHAANEQQGTIISSFSQYAQMYQFLGGTTMAWSGGGSATNPYGSGVSPANAALRRAYTGYGRAYGSTLDAFRF